MLFLPFWINWINWTTELLNSVSLPILLLGLFRIQLLRLCIQLLRLCIQLSQRRNSCIQRRISYIYFVRWLSQISATAFENICDGRRKLQVKLIGKVVAAIMENDYRWFENLQRVNVLWCLCLRKYGMRFRAPIGLNERKSGLS